MLSFLPMFTVCALFMVLSLFMTEEFLKTETDAQLKNAQSKINHEMSDLLQQLTGKAQWVASDPLFSEAVAQRDSAQVRQKALAITEAKMADVVTVIDNDGVVLARGHDTKAGDVMQARAVVKKAMEGQAVSGIEAGNVVKFSARAAVPITQNGKRVGVIIVGSELTKNHVYVDIIKKSFGVECTLFLGDERVSTTATTPEGGRGTGTKLARQDILDAS